MFLQEIGNKSVMLKVLCIGYSTHSTHHFLTAVNVMLMIFNAIAFSYYDRESSKSNRDLKNLYNLQKRNNFHF